MVIKNVVGKTTHKVEKLILFYFSKRHFYGVF